MTDIQLIFAMLPILLSIETFLKKLTLDTILTYVLVQVFLIQ